MEHWETTPANTNINESAHAATNKVTRTRLSLLEAIERYFYTCYTVHKFLTVVDLEYSARKLDKQVEAKVKTAQSSAVLPNHLNTEKHRMSRNTARATGRAMKAMERNNASDTLDGIEDKLAEARARQKEAQEAVKNLMQEKKQLREVTGLKRKPKRAAKVGADVRLMESSQTGIIEGETGFNVPAETAPVSVQQSMLSQQPYISYTPYTTQVNSIYPLISLNSNSSVLLGASEHA